MTAPPLLQPHPLRFIDHTPFTRYLSHYYYSWRQGTEINPQIFSVNFFFVGFCSILVLCTSQSPLSSSDNGVHPPLSSSVTLSPWCVQCDHTTYTTTYTQLCPPQSISHTHHYQPQPIIISKIIAMFSPCSSVVMACQPQVDRGSTTVDLRLQLKTVL